MGGGTGWGEMYVCGGGGYGPMSDESRGAGFDFCAAVAPPDALSRGSSITLGKSGAGHSTATTAAEAAATYLSDVHVLRFGTVSSEPPSWLQIEPDEEPTVPPSSLASVCVLGVQLLVVGGFNHMANANLGSLNGIDLVPDL